MDRPRQLRIRRVAITAGLVAATLVLATFAVSLLEDRLEVPNASAVYLVAVVVCAVVAGTWAAIAAAIGAFLTYNFFFIDPTYTFTIAEPTGILSVVLLLFVGIVVGRLAAQQRERAELAIAREREARALFGVSRVLATRASTEAALGQIVAALRDETAMSRVWIGFGGEPASERIMADTEPADRRPSSSRIRVLQRSPGDEPAVWSLVHQPGRGGRRAVGDDIYRIRIEASGVTLGSIWAARSSSLEEPDRTQTRLLAAAADQVGQALARDRAEAEAQAAEIARQSEALRTSLLQSVSHDFRTPLAVIRAAAGSLDTESGLSDADRHANTQAIEREVEYLNRLVANLLDMSRIDAGVLRADRDIYDLDDALTQALERVRPRLRGRILELDVRPVAVRIDAVFLDAAVANVLDNAVKYTGDAARIRLSTSSREEGMVCLTVEDDGPGVPDEALPSLFEKFYRVPGTRAGSRSGLGLGLAVVRGLMEATGGRVSARRSPLGGLAIDIELPLAPAADVPVEAAGAR